MPVRVLQILNLCTLCCPSLWCSGCILQVLGWRGLRTLKVPAAFKGGAQRCKWASHLGLLLLGGGFADPRSSSACIWALTAARLLTESASRAMPH